MENQSNLFGTADNIPTAEPTAPNQKKRSTKDEPAFKISSFPVTLDCSIYYENVFESEGIELENLKIKMLEFEKKLKLKMKGLLNEKEISEKTIE